VRRSGCQDRNAASDRSDWEADWFHKKVNEAIGHEISLLLLEMIKNDAGLRLKRKLIFLPTTPFLSLFHKVV
jgi:hypothetical protein